MLSVIMLNVTQRFFMLGVIMLSVVILSGVAPHRGQYRKNELKIFARRFANSTADITGLECLKKVCIWAQLLKNLNICFICLQCRI
jgi:hypothetical protein